MKKQILRDKNDMGKVKTKIWLVKINVPTEIPTSNGFIENPEKIEWYFKMVLN